MAVFVFSSFLSINLVRTPVAGAQSSDTTQCTNQVYLSQSNEFSFASRLEKLNLAQNPFTLTTVASPSSSFWNALGYRFNDGYFYATTPDNAAPGGTQGEVFRINSSGVPTSLGTPLPSPTGVGYFAGDVRSTALPGGDGLYYVLDIDDANPSDADTTTFYRVNVSGGTATLSATVNITVANDVRLNDWAFNPIDGNLYGFEQHTRRLIRVNPNSGAAQFIGPANFSIGAVHGAAWFDANGNFYSYNNGDAASNGNLYKMSTANGSVTEINPGGAPSVARNDGASCPFAPLITKIADPEQVVQGGVTTYNYTITNAMQATALVANFDDILQNGRTYVPGTLVNTQIGGTPNAYGNTPNLTISGITVPAGATVSLSIKVNIPINIPAPGTYYNQGCLSNFVISGFGNICSDYPVTTNLIGDPTPINVVPLGPPNAGSPNLTKNPVVVALMIIAPALALAFLAQKFKRRTIS